jgi:predicted membrane channel-forming protein YqfA (hemolysin III family)
MTAPVVALITGLTQVLVTVVTGVTVVGLKFLWFPKPNQRPASTTLPVGRGAAAVVAVRDSAACATPTIAVAATMAKRARVERAVERMVMVGEGSVVAGGDEVERVVRGEL